MYGLDDSQRLATLYKSYYMNEPNAYYNYESDEQLQQELDALLTNDKVRKAAYASCKKAFEVYNKSLPSTYFENYCCFTCPMSNRYLNARYEQENLLLSDIFNNSNAQVPLIDVVLNTKNKRDKELTNIFKSYTLTCVFPCIYRPLNRYFYEFYNDTDPLVFESFTYPSITREDMADMFEEHMKSWLEERILRGVKDESKRRENSLQEFEYDTIIDHLMYLRSLSTDGINVAQLIEELNKPYSYDPPVGSKCIEIIKTREVITKSKTSRITENNENTSSTNKDETLVTCSPVQAVLDVTSKGVPEDASSNDNDIAETGVLEANPLDDSISELAMSESLSELLHSDIFIASQDLTDSNTVSEPYEALDKIDKKIDADKMLSPLESSEKNKNAETDAKPDTQSSQTQEDDEHVSLGGDEDIWLIDSSSARDESADTGLDDNIFIIDSSNFNGENSNNYESDDILWIGNDTVSDRAADSIEADSIESENVFVIDNTEQNNESPSALEIKENIATKIERTFEGFSCSLSEFALASLAAGGYSERILKVETLKDVPKLFEALSGTRPVSVEYISSLDSFLVLSHTTKQSFMISSTLGSDCLWELFSSERLKICINKVPLCWALHKANLPSINIVSLGCMQNTFDSDDINISDIFEGMYFVSDNIVESYMHCYEKAYYNLMERIRNKNLLKLYRDNDAFVNCLGYSYELSEYGVKGHLTIDSVSNIKYPYNMNEIAQGFVVYETTIPAGYLSNNISGEKIFFFTMCHFAYNSIFEKYSIRLLKIQDNQLYVMCDTSDQGVVFDMISDGVRSSYKKLSNGKAIDFSIQLISQ